MNRGIIKILFVIVIGLLLMLLFFYFAQKYLSNGFFASSTPSTRIGAYNPPLNPLLDFVSPGQIVGGKSLAGNTTGASGVNSSGSNGGSATVNTSPYASSVYLGPGDASSDIQPSTEFITLSNNGQSSVDITGWTVENGASERPFQTTGNQAVSVAAKAVKIPQGTEFLSPSGADVVGDIILKPGDSAVLTVGGPFVSYTFPIAYSFRENICSGYFNYSYPFNPSIQDECPTAQNEPDAAAITDVCFSYVENFPSCYNPQLQDANNFKNTLQQNCMDYIESHMNYPGCVAVHGNDSDFSLPVWRIFLGQNQAMWRSENDKIVVLDASGKTVSQISY